MNISSKNLIYVSFFNMFFFLILLLLGEIFIRLLFPDFKVYKRTFPGHVYSNKEFTVDWPKYDSILGWTCSTESKIMFTNTMLNDTNLTYSINTDGFRNNLEFSSVDNTRDRILMLGDSFLFGVYLEDSDIISVRLDDLMDNTDIINLAIPGYGIDQMYLSYLKYVEKIPCNRVIVLFIDDDLMRSYEAYRSFEGLEKPSFEIFEDKLKKRSDPKLSFIEIIFQNSFLLNKFYHYYAELESIELNKKIFLELKKQTVIRQQELYVFRCPTKEELLNNEDFSRFSLKQFFGEEKIFYRDFANDFQKFSRDLIKELYLPTDGHLSSEGTKLVASLMNKIIN